MILDAIMALLPSGSRRQQRRAIPGRIRWSARRARSGALVTFGIVPTRPETGYGYIRKGQSWDGLAGCWHIDRSVESPIWRPPSSTSTGDYAWNSGMFVLPVGQLLSEMERLAPDMLARCQEAIGDAKSDLDFLGSARARSPPRRLPSITR